MTKKQAAEMAEKKARAAETLLKILKPGSIVYTTVTHVSRSGMSRNIKVTAPVIVDGVAEIRDISGPVATLTENRWNGDGSVTIPGCGMDMGFALIYSLSFALFPNGYSIPEGHFRRYDNKPDHFDRDGGYALVQKWA